MSPERNKMGQRSLLVGRGSENLADKDPARLSVKRQVSISCPPSRSRGTKTVSVARRMHLKFSS